MAKWILLFPLLVVLSCASKAQQYITEIDSPTEFSAYSGSPLSAKYGNIASIKVVYELKTKAVYFINSANFKFHYEFCQFQLHDPNDLYQFNTVNYSDNPKRKYLLANLNFSPSLNRYFLDISPYDLMTPSQIETLFNAIKNATFIGEKLHFLLNTTRLIEAKETLQQRLPILLPEDIYENISFQTVSQGKSVGKLRFVTDLDSLETPLHPTDIVVLKKTPMYLPLVAGIIVTEFQTPLSHLSILGQNRKIPICAYKSVFSDEKLRQLNGMSVEFSVKKDTFYVVRNNKNAIPKIKPRITLIKNLKVDTLIDVRYLGLKSVNYAGNKAANFGTLHFLTKNANFSIPEAGFAIPFAFYEKHVASSNVQNWITEATKNSQNPEKLRYYLRLIQESIKNKSVDPQLIQTIEKRLTKSGYTTFRFRSSTNAEDAEGFSGAGLYDSKTVDLTNPTKTIEKAIQKVWASLWSEQAFLERAYFNIDQFSVSMGILVHRSFPNEAVNGVAITKNIYRDNYIGFVINAQLGDVSVVDPPAGVTCDQFICAPKDINSSFTNTIEVIAHSNLNGKKLVMTTAEIENLANQLDLIKHYYFNKISKNYKSYEDFGLDIEFKLDEKTRKLYIKQVRIYNS